MPVSSWLGLELQGDGRNPLCRLGFIRDHFITTRSLPIIKSATRRVFIWSMFGVPQLLFSSSFGLLDHPLA
jgi:hypothetical protein